VVVVGAGFTGLRTALELAQAGVRVVVLEAESVGFGASGRTGGQCNPILRMTPAAAAKALGRRHGENLVQATIASADELFGTIARHRIACDPVQKGWLQAAHSPAAAKRLMALQSAWVAEGARIDRLDGPATRDWSGSAEYVAALHHPTAGHVQPLSLVRGFAGAVLAQGGRIFEHSRAKRIERLPARGWRVVTADGDVTAAWLVVATNGYTDGLVPELRRSILPMVSLLAATAPLGPAQRAAILPRLTTIADTRRAIYYARFDRDHRLAIGCLGSSAQSPARLGGLARLKAGAVRIFPALRDVEWQYAWGGHIAVTPDFLPHLHEPAPGLLIGLGFNGRGVAMSSVMGRALAAKILGAAESTLPFPVTPLRAMPWHRLLSMVLPLAAPALAARDGMDRLAGRA
jgi:sarcosine oxidase